MHDDLLFNAQLNTGFTGLLCLGEMTWPNRIALRDYKKVTMCFSMEWTQNSYSFWLLTYKANTTFKGNQIVVKEITRALTLTPSWHNTSNLKIFSSLSTPNSGSNPMAQPPSVHGLLNASVITSVHTSPGNPSKWAVPQPLLKLALNHN